MSLLPFPVLYIFSDFLCFVLFNLIGYRKKVVLQNLRNAFPEKSDKEIDMICRKYYHYLCDLFLETFKTLTISKKSMLMHCTMTDGAKALFSKYADENKNIVLVMGHFGNWEWGGNVFSLTCTQQLYVIYHPIANKYFDRLMYRMRTRFGSKLIAMKNTYKDMLNNRGGINVTAFIADQTPQPQNAYWTTFLCQETPVFKGTEVIARKFNSPVIYARVKKTKRGYYRIDAELLSENPASMSEGALSELHTMKLQEDIISLPETWLWSHRRWKHKRTIS